MEVKAAECRFVQVDGHRLSGTLYEPDSPTEAGIVFLHGFCGTQEVVAPAIAEALVRRGRCVVLTFDYSGFGRSGGLRGRLDPGRQVRDAVAAATWLAHEKALAGRVGFFGLNLGGAVGLAAGAVSPVVAFVATLNSPSDGEVWMRELRPYWQWLELGDAIRDDEIRRVRGFLSRCVPPDWVMPRSPESVRYNRELAAARPERVIELDVASAQLITEFRPLEGWSQGRQPSTLVMHCLEDSLVPFSHATSIALATNGRLLGLDLGHYDVYGEVGLARVADAVHALAVSGVPR